jgi:outer membrane protein assembly factor BamB
MNSTECNNPNRGNNRKEKRMNVVTKALSLAASVTMGLALAAGAAETPATNPGPACGHADFVPTPEHPVYFRWSQGYFPGAQPPLEWWDGTPEQVEVEITDKSGKARKTKVWRFADQKSKNILWKAPAGGWGLSHPIVVGDKVFSVGVPDVITCNDLATGKQLWQKRAMPLLMDGVPEEKAAAVQKVFDLVRALWLIGHADHGANPDCIGLGGGNNVPEDAKFLKGTLEGEDLKRLLARKRESVAKVIRMLQAHRGEVVATGEADLVKALDADLADLEAWFKMDDQGFAAELKTQKNRGENLRSACMKKYQIPFTTEWSGYVSVADSTLASDGRYIYGVFDQGQTFCYDLDGALKWGVREKGGWDTRVTFHSSPVLCDGVLVVKKRASGGCDSPRKGVWIGLDAATGKQLWEATIGISNFAVPRPMRLTGADGAPVAVLIGDTDMEKGPDPLAIHPNLKGQAIVRVRDGRILGYLPNFAICRGAIMTVHGDLVAVYSHDNGGPDMALRVRMTGPDTAAGEVVWSHTGKEPRILRYRGFPTQLGDYLLNGFAADQQVICDVRDGSQVASLGRVRWFEDASGVVAGRHLIFWTEANSGGRTAAQPDAMLRFQIFDLSDPKNPKPVANNNLIGFKDPPADLVVRTYLKEFDPYGFTGVYSGTASYCAMMGGPVPVGNKLIIQTSAFLYCIGLREASGPQVGLREASGPQVGEK